MFRWVVLFLALTLVPVAVQAQADVHRVVAGETLWAIAGQRYGAAERWQEIYEANRDILKDPHRIFPGEQLKIPVGRATSPAASPETVVVVAGETLWEIAGRHYGAARRWPEIFAANRDVVADPNLIFPGEQLRIPAGRTSAPTAVVVAPAPAPAPDTSAAPPPTIVVAAPPGTDIPTAAPEPPSGAVPEVVQEVVPEVPPQVSPEIRADAAPVAPATQPRPPHAGAPPVPPMHHEAEPPPHGPEPSRVAAPAQYGVRPGDEVEMILFSAAAKPLTAAEGPRVVDLEGNVDYPFIGSVHVQGLDALAIRALLAEKFSDIYRDPVVSLNVKLRVNVTGLVGTPGHYLLDPSATVLDALSSAGGIGVDLGFPGSAAADASAVQLIRNGETTRLDLRPASVSPAALTMPVQSGDWIHVPARVESRRRDDVRFWSGVLALISSAAATVTLLTGR